MSGTVLTQGEVILSPPSKVPTKCRGWVFTKNNPEEHWFGTVEHDLKSFEFSEWVAQEEVGESGTPHIQGALYFKNAVSFATVKEILKGAHIEQMKGKKSDQKYCEKDDTHHGRRWKRGFSETKEKKGPRDRMEGKTWHPWQLECVELLKQEPDDRTIHWYYDPIGGCGKTCFSQSLALKGDTLVVNGKQADVMFGLAQWVKAHKNGPRVVIWVAPRDHQDWINYGAIETIKDGLFFSGKYESGMVIYDPPHLLVFCNIKPAPGKLSEGRIVLHELSSMPAAGAGGKDGPSPGGLRGNKRKHSCEFLEF
nr:MAG: replication associated protein [Cressdnaviricota sp.]